MADRYWVAGTGTWDNINTANWAATSGGLGGETVPTSADDVFFDAGSALVNYSVTISTGAVCKNLSVVGPLTGTLTLANTASPLDIHGGLSVAASGVTWNYSSGLITFLSTATGNQITLNGRTLPNNVTFNGIGGEWVLQDSFAITANRGLTLTNGVLDLNDNTFTCGQFASNNANTRSIAFGTGKIVSSNNNTTVLNFANSTGFTYTGSGVVEFAYSGATGTRTFAFGAQAGEANFLNIKIIAGTDTVNNSSAYYVKDLNFTGFAGTWNSGSTIFIYGDLTVSATQTVSAANPSLVFSKSSGTQQVTTAGITIDRPVLCLTTAVCRFVDALTLGATRTLSLTSGTVEFLAGSTNTAGTFAIAGSPSVTLQSSIPGTQYTLSQASGTVNASNMTVSDANASGGAIWNAFVSQGNVDAGNNTGWDFLVQLGRYIYTRRKNKVILQS